MKERLRWLGRILPMKDDRLPKIVHKQQREIKLHKKILSSMITPRSCSSSAIIMAGIFWNEMQNFAFEWVELEHPGFCPQPGVVEILQRRAIFF